MQVKNLGQIMSLLYVFKGLAKFKFHNKISLTFPGIGVSDDHFVFEVCLSGNFCRLLELSGRDENLSDGNSWNNRVANFRRLFKKKNGITSNFVL